MNLDTLLRTIPITPPSREIEEAEYAVRIAVTSHRFGVAKACFRGMYASYLSAMKPTDKTPTVLRRILRTESDDSIDAYRCMVTIIAAWMQISSLETAFVRSISYANMDKLYEISELEI